MNKEWSLTGCFIDIEYLLSLSNIQYLFITFLLQVLFFILSAILFQQSLLNNLFRHFDSLSFKLHILLHNSSLHHQFQLLFAFGMDHSLMSYNGFIIGTF